VNDLTNI